MPTTLAAIAATVIPASLSGHVDPFAMSGTCAARGRHAEAEDTGDRGVLREGGAPA
ncbi:hypothetical protein A7982_13296 [Minicystis rosea]|nr:hypothetical protein A7982_13296 [Minicystis rosea]